MILRGVVLLIRSRLEKYEWPVIWKSCFIYNPEENTSFFLGKVKMRGTAISYFWCFIWNIGCSAAQGSEDQGTWEVENSPSVRLGFLPECFTKSFFFDGRLILSMTWWYYGLEAKILWFHLLMGLKGDILYTPISIRKWNSLLLY